jgi:hypothetical protein
MWPAVLVIRETLQSSVVLLVVVLVVVLPLLTQPGKVVAVVRPDLRYSVLPGLAAPLVPFQLAPGMPDQRFSLQCTSSQVVEVVEVVALVTRGRHSIHLRLAATVDLVLVLEVAVAVEVVAALVLPVVLEVTVEMVWQLS